MPTTTSTQSIIISVEEQLTELREKTFKALMSLNKQSLSKDNRSKETNRIFSEYENKKNGLRVKVIHPDNPSPNGDHLDGHLLSSSGSGIRMNSIQGDGQVRWASLPSDRLDPIFEISPSERPYRNSGIRYQEHAPYRSSINEIAIDRMRELREREEQARREQESRSTIVRSWYNNAMREYLAQTQRNT